MKKKLKKWYVLTCEHRRYVVDAKSKEEADEFIENEANLEPKDKRVKLFDMGHFEVVK